MNRREFIKLATMALGGVLSHADTVLANGDVSRKKKFRDADVRSMEFKVDYITDIITPPKLGEKVEFWVPLPGSDEEQEITQLSIKASQPIHINEEQHYKNKIAYIASASLKAGDRIAVSYKIKRKRSGTIIDREEDINKHLVLTQKETWDDNITGFVDSVVGEEKEPLEVGRKIYHALVDYLRYDKTIPGCGLGISKWTFENKAGRCDDFHALFRTMMIYKGIPVRWEQGIPLPYPSKMTKEGSFEGDCTGAHCWARFYVGDGRWVPVDVSEADKRADMREYFFGTVSPNRFKLSTGRDITLSPPQKGEPLSQFYFTYGETDGIPLIYGHHFKNKISYKVLNVEV